MEFDKGLMGERPVEQVQVLPYETYFLNCLRRDMDLLFSLAMYSIVMRSVMSRSILQWVPGIVFLSAGRRHIASQQIYVL